MIPCPLECGYEAETVGSVIGHVSGSRDELHKGHGGNEVKAMLRAKGIDIEENKEPKQDVKTEPDEPKSRETPTDDADDDPAQTQGTNPAFDGPTGDEPSTPAQDKPETTDGKSVAKPMNQDDDDEPMPAGEPPWACPWCGEQALLDARGENVMKKGKKEYMITDAKTICAHCLKGHEFGDTI